MNAPTATPLMTIEEFNALPVDDSVERELIHGVVWEEPFTPRNRWHGAAVARLAHLLNVWVDGQSQPRGGVFSGGVGCDLSAIDTSVGIDVAYFSAETLATQPEDVPYLVGAPVLAVEILSPSDVVERMHEKIQGYLDAGVALVWSVDTDFETITVYRPDDNPRMFSGDEELSADPHLPGFVVAASLVFDR
jgi:Uma2 family endonuclease